MSQIIQLQATADTHTNQYGHSLNYGLDDDLYLSSSKTSGANYRHTLLIKFDGLKDYADTMTSAKIKFTQICSNTDRVPLTGNVCFLLKDWVETEATYDLYKNGSAWSSAGGTGAGTDYDIDNSVNGDGILGSTTFDARNPVGTVYEIELDVDALRQNLINHEQYNGFIIISGSLYPKKLIKLASRENSNKSYKPILEITIPSHTIEDNELIISHNSKQEFSQVFENELNISHSNSINIGVSTQQQLKFQVSTNVTYNLELDISHNSSEGYVENDWATSTQTLTMDVQSPEYDHIMYNSDIPVEFSSYFYPTTSNWKTILFNTSYYLTHFEDKSYSGIVLLNSIAYSKHIANNYLMI